MRPLKSCLLDEPLPRLTAIADTWDIGLEVATAREMAEALAERMLAAGAARRAVDALPDDARAALSALGGAAGRMPAAAFERRFGALRPMGPGRLERERPWLSPANATETLWYRGFLFRGFDRNLPNPTEVLYVPGDLLKLLSDAGEKHEAGEESVEAAPSWPAPGAGALDTALLDDIVTLLSHIQNAEVRLAPGGGWRPQARQAVLPALRDADGAEDERRGSRFAFAAGLMARMGWLKATQPTVRLSPQPVIAWLQRDAGAQLAALAEAWRDDPGWNDLAQVDAITFDMEHAWSNNPLQERAALLQRLADWPGAARAAWFLIDDFVQHVHDAAPEFARVDGRYDTWHIRDTATGEYLSGYEHWPQVEGRLIRRLLTGPLRWLAMTAVQSNAACLTEFGRAVLSRLPVELAGAGAPTGLRVGVDGVVNAPSAARYPRFQLARVADWIGMDNARYTYRLTPASLARGREQGILAARVGEFLQQHSETPVPPNVLKAIRQWGEHGVQVRLESACLLRARDAAMLDALLNLPAVQAGVIERLAPGCAIVRARDTAAVMDEIVGSGLLVDADQEHGG